jgi:serine/threonine protein kinase
MEIMRQEGTPKLCDWREISNHPHFKPCFPKFQKIKRAYANLDEKGVQLLESMITLNPKKRTSIEDALRHSYFD